MELFKPGKTYDFMRQRVFWIPLSIFLTVASVVLTFYPGPNYGTDFRGGTEIEVAFKRDVDGAAVRRAVEESHQFSEPDVIEVRDPQKPNRFMIRVQEISTVDDSVKAALVKALCFSDAPETLDPATCPEGARATEVKFSPGGDKITTRYASNPNRDAIRAQIQTVSGVKLRSSENNIVLLGEQDNAGSESEVRDHKVEIQLQSKGDQLMDVLREQLGADTVPDEALRVEWVGGKAGKQLRDSARNAVAITIVCIMLYLAFRFDLRFAPGVILACVHDAMVVLGVFVLTGREVTLATLAAILTVVGYSMNDTIVVYDRIRENLSRYRGKTFAEIINLSVSETLSRTLLTSGGTSLSVVAFFIWGTGVIKDFAFAVIIGIVAGTYSSIYVAAPLTEWIDAQMRKRQAAGASSAKPLTA